MTKEKILPAADFSYTVKRKDGIPILIIVDKNLGNMSVTNDIENVVDFICKKEKLQPKDCAIIYRDSHNCWDGWNPINKWFVALSTKDQGVATKKILKFKHSH